GCVTFEDMTIYLSQEEWGLLGEAQRLLYSNVMLENFALPDPLTCRGWGREGRAAGRAPSVLEQACRLSHARRVQQCGVCSRPWILPDLVTPSPWAHRPVTSTPHLLSRVCCGVALRAECSPSAALSFLRTYIFQAPHSRTARDGGRTLGASEWTCLQPRQEGPTVDLALIFERLAQNRNPKTTLSTQKDMCGLHLKDILHLGEHQETHSMQKPHVCETYGRELELSANFHLPQTQQSVDEPIRRDASRTSFVKICRDNTPAKRFTFKEAGRNLVARSSFPQPQSSSSTEEPRPVLKA
ncbi:Zinc finger protein 792, partial [Galemys pyrenaicus]